MIREIGGYIEFEHYHGGLFHDNAIPLNCGRNALAYLLKTRKIKKIFLPRFICDSIIRVCEREGVKYYFYNIGIDFKPTIDFVLNEDEWLYFVNYYSQFNNDEILKYVSKYPNIIVDQSHSYFQQPIPDVDTLYTCRKYFGVADGAFLYTNAFINNDLPIDESFDRMRFLMGRFERTASDFYNEYILNNDFFAKEPVKQMSLLTSNLLRGIDYKYIKEIREKNYIFLNKSLDCINELKLNSSPGTFMYPLMVNNGNNIRKKLLEKKIYIPTLWPDVFEWCNKSDMEYNMALNILPIPIDQRYGIEDMKYIISEILKCL